VYPEKTESVPTNTAEIAPLELEGIISRKTRKEKPQ
jgi:hypothetical protein